MVGAEHFFRDRQGGAVAQPPLESAGICPDLLRTWQRRGHDIGFGVGISQDYATLGQIGFAERMDYTAFGRSPALPLACAAKRGSGRS